MKLRRPCHLTAQTYSLQKKLRFTPQSLQFFQSGRRLIGSCILIRRPAPTRPHTSPAPESAQPHRPSAAQLLTHDGLQPLATVPQAEDRPQPAGSQPSNEPPLNQKLSAAQKAHSPDTRFPLVAPPPASS